MSSEHPLHRLRANLQWKAWSLILGQGPVFLSFFKLGYYITLHALNIKLYESQKKSNEYQLPCEIRFNSSVNGLFGQVLSILRVCVALYLHQNHEPCWQPAASAAWNKTRSKCFMKQTYTSLPDFLVTSLLPAAASNPLGVALFLLLWHLYSHSLNCKYQTSPHHGATQVLTYDTSKQEHTNQFGKHVKSGK